MYSYQVRFNLSKIPLFLAGLPQAVDMIALELKSKFILKKANWVILQSCGKSFECFGMSRLPSARDQNNFCPPKLQKIASQNEDDFSLNLISTYRDFTLGLSLPRGSSQSGTEKIILCAE